MRSEYLHNYTTNYTHYTTDTDKQPEDTDTDIDRQRTMECF